jgi:hypothetical protein
LRGISEASGHVFALHCSVGSGIPGRIACALAIAPEEASAAGQFQNTAVVHEPGWRVGPLGGAGRFLEVLVSITHESLIRVRALGSKAL